MTEINNTEEWMALNRHWAEVEPLLMRDLFQQGPDPRLLAIPCGGGKAHNRFPARGTRSPPQEVRLRGYPAVEFSLELVGADLAR